VYLGKRDFTDGGENLDPIDGVVVVDNDYLRGRKVYGRVTTTYRYGREEDEVMGLKFSKELVLASQQIVPSGENLKKLTNLQVKENLYLNTFSRIVPLQVNNEIYIFRQTRFAQK